MRPLWVLLCNGVFLVKPQVFAFRYFRQSVNNEWLMRLAAGTENFVGLTVEIDCMTITNVYDDINNRHIGALHIFGMLEVATGRIRLHRVMNQAAATLVPLIQSTVPAGTIVYTDSHRSFWNLNALPYFHYTVNHSAGDYAHWITILWATVSG
jgi:hypothetical protein